MFRNVPLFIPLYTWCIGNLGSVIKEMGYQEISFSKRQSVSFLSFTQLGLLTEMTIKPNDLSENALSLEI